jgi:hypothetical protein
LHETPGRVANELLEKAVTFSIAPGEQALVEQALQVHDGRLRQLPCGDIDEEFRDACGTVGTSGFKTPITRRHSVQ